MSCRQVTDRTARLRNGISPRKFRQSVVVGKGRSHTMLTRSSKALAQKSPPRPGQSGRGRFGRGLSPRDPRNRFLGTIKENTTETKFGETSPSLATRFAAASPSSHRMRPIRGRGQYGTKVGREETIREDKGKENKNPSEVICLGEVSSRSKLGYRERKQSGDSSVEDLEPAPFSCSPPGHPKITFLPGIPLPESALGSSLGDILSNIRASAETSSDPQMMDVTEDTSGNAKRIWVSEAFRIIEEMSRSEREALERSMNKMDTRSDYQRNRELNEAFERARRHQQLSEQFAYFRGKPQQEAATPYASL